LDCETREERRKIGMIFTTEVRKEANEKEYYLVFGNDVGLASFTKVSDYGMLRWKLVGNASADTMNKRDVPRGIYEFLFDWLHMSAVRD
jgi:hypothetical protein